MIEEKLGKQSQTQDKLENMMKEVKETEVKVVQRKPSVQEKPIEKRPENRGKKNWAALRKSISQVRCIMHIFGRQLFSFLVV